MTRADTWHVVGGETGGHGAQWQSRQVVQVTTWGCKHTPDILLHADMIC